MRHPPTGPATEPASATPPRRPGSVRRTTTHDSRRPDGLLGPVGLDARGRDLLTAADGTPVVLDEARVEAEIAMPERTIAAIAVEPSHPGITELVGIPSQSGFRAAVDAALPGERGSAGVRFQLLDDVPTALLVSGYALRHVGGRSPRPPRLRQHPDLCAGWVADGTIVTARERDGLPPTPFGPPAPDVEAGPDAFAWHATDPLDAHAMRRRRRIDVWDADGAIGVEAFFRDSHMDPDGIETIVHEWTVRATVDPYTRTFLASDATIGSLPWPECPNAQGSAIRLTGAPVVGTRILVRDTFTGPTTCTHLNDTLRSLEDVGALWDALVASRPTNGGRA